MSLDGGYLAEAEISYAGPNALARAKLAADTVRKRLVWLGIDEPCRVEIIRSGTVHDSDDSSRFDSQTLPDNNEYRLRAAIRSASQTTAQRVADEVLALYGCGPSADGGVRQSVTPQVSTASVLVDRVRVEENTHAMEVHP